MCSSRSSRSSRLLTVALISASFGVHAIPAWHPGHERAAGRSGRAPLSAVHLAAPFEAITRLLHCTETSLGLNNGNKNNEQG